MKRALANTKPTQAALSFCRSTCALSAQKTPTAKKGKASKLFAWAAFALALNPVCFDNQDLGSELSKSLNPHFAVAAHKIGMTPEIIRQR